MLQENPTGYTTDTSYSLKTGKTVIQADPVFAEGPLPGWQMAAFSLYAHERAVGWRRREGERGGAGIQSVPPLRGPLIPS